jgi:hypothetical protein
MTIRRSTAPFASRRTKAGIILIPNRAIKDVPRPPVDSRWGMAAYGIASKKLLVSRLVLHRDTRMTRNFDPLLLIN